MVNVCSSGLSALRYAVGLVGIEMNDVSGLSVEMISAVFDKSDVLSLIPFSNIVSVTSFP